ncbi:PPOX class F420-dependent oxidoreductase [Rudaeicoccus suwonensis]|uniref:PPOX class probable F420-dependent enzyme n=1 Tax=Rudaeicoccus suwonensis TaxID=657409 RepID=A0A561E3L8_9MICO|nr:PPOX class F420-dependent oxidoreductase [Rudaeicoccus suwonensis]TWE10207.1 PPOX class probable F420-dependent enzyme [Rudaeicoccus suwonensis]
MAPRIATADTVDRAALDEFVRTRHRATLVTRKRSGGLQLSLVTCGLGPDGRILISTYPQRAKVANIRHDARVSLLIQSDGWDDAYVQLDGAAKIIDMPEATEPLVDYFRCISGEHSDWDEYREAMRRQNKSLICVEITGWGPVATGGFPPS